MKNFTESIHIFAIISLLMLTGCVKSEFSITFQFPKDHLGNYLVNYYAWDSKKGAWIESVASVQNGTALVQGISSRPTLVYIRDASSSNNSMPIYVERGDKIIISGDKSDMNTWTVKGNKLTERWTRWRNKNADILSKDRDKFTKEKEKAITDFVSANKTDKLSTLILLTSWDRRANADGFLKLWNSLDDDAKSKQLIEMCGSTDLLGVEFEVDAKGKLVSTKSKKVNDIIFRTRDNGVDTLRFKNKKASILFFYADNDSWRKQVMDSLRAVAKEYPDSASRVISTVALQPDSMAWISSVRNDTIKAVVCAWVPEGVADRNMIDLGVARLPWFIVMGKEGKEAYAGDNAIEALAAFRSQMKVKPHAPESKSKK